MSKIIAAASTGLILLAALIASLTYSGNASETSNIEVQKALTSEQNTDLKMSKTTAEVANAHKDAIDLEEKTALVLASYPVSDPWEQQQSNTAVAQTDDKD